VTTQKENGIPDYNQSQCGARRANLGETNHIITIWRITTAVKRREVPQLTLLVSAAVSLTKK